MPTTNCRLTLADTDVVHHQHQEVKLRSSILVHLLLQKTPGGRAFGGRVSIPLVSHLTPVPRIPDNDAHRVSVSVINITQFADLFRWKFLGGFSGTMKINRVEGALTGVEKFHLNMRIERNWYFVFFFDQPESIPPTHTLTQATKRQAHDRWPMDACSSRVSSRRMRNGEELKIFIQCVLQWCTGLEDCRGCYWWCRRWRCWKWRWQWRQTVQVCNAFVLLRRNYSYIVKFIRVYACTLPNIFYLNYSARCISCKIVLRTLPISIYFLITLHKMNRF